ncbi:MAG: phosphoglycerate kinase [Bacteroidetes bacterium]|nr:MAG: phosphoglycerate kinase [Bacteroidota bacterium]
MFVHIQIAFVFNLLIASSKIESKPISFSKPGPVRREIYKDRSALLCESAAEYHFGNRIFVPLKHFTNCMKTVDQFHFGGKKALIRVDFNVPLDKSSFAVTDDTRIRAAIPTIQKIRKDGGAVILMSHLGRPKEGPEEKYSLKHIISCLEGLLGTNVKFAADCIGAAAETAASALQPGEVLLLENLRFYKEEEKGDANFAGKLAKLGDFYVNDAFGTAHRAHASTAVIAKFFPGSKCFGYVMSGELASINKVLNGAARPFTAIMGGAKVSDKILILEQLIKKADNIIIGGGMAFTFIKAMGGNIGKSLVEEDRLATALSILDDAKKRGVHIYLPVDALAADAFDNNANRKTCDVKQIPDGWMGLDVGPETEKINADVIAKSKTILWNGPMGVFEMSHFESGTKSAAFAIAAATKNGTYTLIGGGDSVAAINKYKLGDQVSYVSTGGGALLEYIESGTLPGVKAVEE